MSDTPAIAFDRNAHIGAYLLPANPEASEWRCELFGTPNWILIPAKGDEPNWFWRKMQFLCFGNRWTKGKP